MRAFPGPMLRTGGGGKGQRWGKDASPEGLPPWEGNKLAERLAGNSPPPPPSKQHWDLARKMWPLVFAKPRGLFGYWWGMDCEMEWIAQVNTRPDGR